MSEKPMHAEGAAAEEGTCSAASADDPAFAAEQAHLSETCAKLREIGRHTARELERVRREAAADKQSMADELSRNFASDDEAMETYADFAAVNRIVAGYNMLHDAHVRKLADVQLLLRRPYFAKLVLQFGEGKPPKDVYLGAAGMSDDSCRRIVVDWRSPVAEVYYNQGTGPVSYEADGRIIHTDLKLRRQFDIDGEVLNAYFDTNVAIQDSLLLASLSRQRSAHMRDITATIQREQNVVVRHEDVDVLLVGGIAGSGKTSVLMQRIAYLLYRNRGRLDASQLHLITPNEVFRRYIENVLPDMGESNPHMSTWDEFATALLPAGRGGGHESVPAEVLERIDAAMGALEFDGGDFRDVSCNGVRLVSAAQIAQVAAKHRRADGAAHRVALMREDILARLKSRLARMSTEEATLLEVESLSVADQVEIFHETVAPQDEREERAVARRYIDYRFAAAYEVVNNDEWLRIDRIGMRVLGEQALDAVTWLYLRLALTGLADAEARYVMVDEVQNYTTAQLAVLARYFKRAHFLLLGDENQAIRQGTASFAEVRALFERLRGVGAVHECSLMTSYRSTPAVTELFAGVLGNEVRGRVQSVRREQTEPHVRAFEDEGGYVRALREAVTAARFAPAGLTAVIAPWKAEARRLAALLGEDAPPLVDDAGALPEAGVVLITLEKAAGLEFDRVIVPDASARVFPDEPLARRRLYTTISRATREVEVLAHGRLTPLLVGMGK